jgi:hypothetical protein
MRLIGEVLQKIRPGAEWVARGDFYENIEWLDKTQSKPSKEEFEAEKNREMSAKEALLMKLGITEEEAKLLLG